MSKLVYEGSVKNLWEIDSTRLEFEYTDAYSVFDWGRMPDGLGRKGESLAALGAYFFKMVSDPGTWKGIAGSRWIKPLMDNPRFREFLEPELKTLEREGLRHHFVERSAPDRLVVRRVAAIPPDEHKLAGQTLYHYRNQHVAAACSSARLIPLEVIFRFGMPKGSSLVERLTKDYARQLGFDSVPTEGTMFDHPIIEFFTKLEDTDRFLTWEQALNYSGLEFPEFKKLAASTFALAAWLSQIFEKNQLELWDGKFEWALIDGKIALVDSIGPDELRLLDPSSRTQISKEFLRLFYRDTEWFEAVKKAKKDAELDNRLDWKQLVLDRVGAPPRLSEEFRSAGDALYPSLALALTGENPGGAGLPLKAMLERIRKCLAR